VTLVTGSTPGTIGRVEITCPRCRSIAEVRFYGPCDTCRVTLRDQFRIEGRVVELAEYEPKMNVTPNAVAVKD
jgi:phage FluMu protein Com